MCGGGGGVVGIPGRTCDRPGARGVDGETSPVASGMDGACGMCKPSTEPRGLQLWVVAANGGAGGVH